MQKTITLRGWPLGMNNMAPEYGMPEGSLRDATNVDVLNDGKLRSRAGYQAAVLAGTNMHSLYSYKGLTLMVINGALCRINSSWGQTVLRSGLSLQARVAYQVVNEDVVWSNGAVTGVVSLAGDLRAFGVETPASQPTLSPTTPGNLAEGEYKVAVTFLSRRGEESGTPACARVAITDGQAISLSRIPQPTSAEVDWLGIYVTEPNGSIPYLSVLIPVGVPELTISQQAIKGRELVTQFCLPFPPCEHLTLLGGRLCGSLGSSLIFSEPFAYGRHRLGASTIYFPSAITILRAVEDGLWVVADKTYFMAGREPGKQQLVSVLPYGAVPGTDTPLPNGQEFLWFSERGFVVAGNGGSITNLTEEGIAVEAFSSGAATVREQNGLRQGIASLKRGNASNQFVVSDYVEGEVIRGRQVVSEVLADGLSTSEQTSNT